MKKCVKCGKEHPLNWFKRNKTYKDGYSGTCKDCVNEYNQLTKEKRNATHKRWRERNIERLRARDRIRDHEPERRFNKSIAQAKRRNLEWEISFEDFKNLCPLPCNYCNNKLEDRSKSTYAALDRINNTIGYTIENVLPCCSTCNYLRGDLLSVDETHQVVNLLIAIRSL